MKKLIFLFTVLFCAVSVSAQKEKLNALFEKFQEADGVTSIKIAKPMFNMLSKLDLDEADVENIQPILSKIDGIKILVVDKPVIDDSLSVEGKKKISSFNALSKDISSAVSRLNYEELITVNSKNNKIKFLSADTSKGNFDELLLNINSDGNNILMMLEGKISIDDVNGLVNEVNK